MLRGGSSLDPVAPQRARPPRRARSAPRHAAAHGPGDRPRRRVARRGAGRRRRRGRDLLRPVRAGRGAPALHGHPRRRGDAPDVPSGGGEAAAAARDRRARARPRRAVRRRRSRDALGCVRRSPLWPPARGARPRSRRGPPRRRRDLPRAPLPSLARRSWSSSGKVDVADVLALVRRRFGGWRGPDGSSPPVRAPAPPTTRVLVVDKPDVTQSQVRIASLGFPRRSPDYIPGIVASALLGGGFTSRLMEAIRVNRGLSYGVRSRFATSASGGVFFVSTFTKVETTAEIVEVALQETARFCEERAGGRGARADEELPLRPLPALARDARPARREARRSRAVRSPRRRHPAVPRSRARGRAGGVPRSRRAAISPREARGRGGGPGEDHRAVARALRRRSRWSPRGRWRDRRRRGAPGTPRGRGAARGRQAGWAHRHPRARRRGAQPARGARGRAREALGRAPARSRHDRSAGVRAHGGGAPRDEPRLRPR